MEYNIIQLSYIFLIHGQFFFSLFEKQSVSPSSNRLNYFCLLNFIKKKYPKSKGKLDTSLSRKKYRALLASCVEAAHEGKTTTFLSNDGMKGEPGEVALEFSTIRSYCLRQFLYVPSAH